MPPEESELPPAFADLLDAEPGETIIVDETETFPDRDSAAHAEEEARKRSVGPRSSRGSGVREGGLSPSLGGGASGGTSLSTPFGKSTDERLDDLEDDVERIEAKLDALLQLLDADVDVSHE